MNSQGKLSMARHLSPTPLAWVSSAKDTGEDASLVRQFEAFRLVAFLEHGSIVNSIHDRSSPKAGIC